MRVEFEGRYQLWVEREGKITQETPWFDNLITNNGLDLIGTGYDVNCYVGSGTTPPAYTDTQLESYAASVGYLEGWSDDAGLSETPQYRSRFVRYRADIGAISGQVSEVGIGPSSTDLVSRALLPAVLQLDGELDRLYVTWEFRQCIPAEDVVGAVFLAGATRSYRAYPVDIGSHSAHGVEHSGWNVVPGEGIYTSTYEYQHDVRLRINDSWQQKPDSWSWRPKWHSSNYVWGSHRILIYVNDFGPGLTGSISGFKFARGWDSFGRRRVNGGAWQMEIDPPFSIEDHQRLHVDFTISWDRCDAAATPEDPVDPSYPALFYDIEITESLGRFELAAETTDTGNSYYSIIDLTSEEPTLLDYTAISAVNTHTASTGLAVESLGSTDYGHLVRFYADTLTDPFEGAVILGHQMRNCDDDAFVQYATMRDLRSGGGQFFAPRCNPTLTRTDLVAEFYICRTTYARFAITSSDTSDVEVGVYQHSAAEPFLLPIDLIDAINAETVNTGIAAELARELRGGFIVRAFADPSAYPFDATLTYEYDAYDWTARSWSRSTDTLALGFSSAIPIQAEGSQVMAIITSEPGYIVYTFAADTEIAVGAPLTVDLLVVGGGGGGGSKASSFSVPGGGGGAGGFREVFSHSVSAGAYSIVVGAGGNGGAYSDRRGQSGAASSAFGVESAGGGGGGCREHRDGLSGGCGGGAADDGSGGAGNTPATDPPQGTNGNSGPGFQNAAGGGGGADLSYVNESSPVGAPGRLSSVTGTYYAGGGAGGKRSGYAVAATGGVGGGGSNTDVDLRNGVAGTGGGGAGGGDGAEGDDVWGAGGNGGSGVVIIRVPV